MADHVLDTHDALGLAHLIARREVAADELLDEAIARADRMTERLNFIAHPMADYGRAALTRVALGAPFAGVPFLVKDLHIDIAGHPTRGGSRYLGDHVASVNSTIVDRYEAAGLVIFGKTTTPEFGLTHSTESVAHGPTRNPWNPERTAGGSSGGAAVAVATHVVPAAQASDGGGSIRTPASCCGLFGLKPSRGRVPMGPHRTEGWLGLSTVHAITRSVRDSAALLDAVHGIEPGSRYGAPTPERPFLAEVGRDPGRLRIALMRRSINGRDADPAVLAALDDAAALLAALGHHVEAAMPRLDVAAIGQATVDVIAASTALDLADRAAATGRAHRDDELELVTRNFAAMGASAHPLAHARANSTFDVAAIAVARFMADYDLILSPTVAKPPVPLGLLGLDPPALNDWVREVSAFGPFTGLYNQTGQPAMSVPLAWSDDGLPIGIMFAARYGDEATLFRLAAQLETARPWKDRRPPIDAGR